MLQVLMSTLFVLISFATVPDVTWADIGALDELREELDMSILQPITNPELFESVGLSVPAGVCSLSMQCAGKM